MTKNDSLLERLGGRAVLLDLLKHFYADVRQHRVIGPVFEQRIEDWPAHIEKIAGFWTQVTGGPPAYGGGMPGAHIPLSLSEEHFQAWLGLWKANCQQRLAPDCAREMSALADQIAIRLRQFCGVPSPAADPASRFTLRPK